MWCRYHEGISRDPKWRAIARELAAADRWHVRLARFVGLRAPAPRPTEIFAVWGWLMDEANQADARGSIARFDAGEVAAFYDLAEEQIRTIVAAFERRGMIVDGRLAAWDKRNPQREDAGSTQRVRAFRQRQRANDDAAETLVKRSETQRNAPESEVDYALSLPLSAPPLSLVAGGLERAVDDGTRAKARARSPASAEEHKRRRDLWLGNIIAEAWRTMPPDRAEAFTVAVGDPEVPRWAKDELERLDRQVKGRRRRGSAPRARGMRQAELLLPIAGDREAA